MILIQILLIRPAASSTPRRPLWEPAGQEAIFGHFTNGLEAVNTASLATLKEVAAAHGWEVKEVEAS